VNQWWVVGDQTTKTLFPQQIGHLASQSATDELEAPWWISGFIIIIIIIIIISIISTISIIIIIIINWVLCGPGNYCVCRRYWSECERCESPWDGVKSNNVVGNPVTLHQIW
jgi:hypothetical protein